MTTGVRITAAKGKAELRIEGAIGGGLWEDGITPADVAAALKSAGKVSEIQVVINSGGGVAFDGIAIRDQLSRHKARIMVRVEGLAASAASMIAMAGERIVMAPGSMMMIHQPRGVAVGSSDDMADMANTLGKMDSEWAAIYAKRTGQDKERVLELMNAETWMTGKEAVELGFADEAEDTEEVKGESITATLAASMVALLKYGNVPPCVAVVDTQPAPIGVGQTTDEEPNMADPVVPKETAPAEPQAASFDELKAAVPKADAEFLCAQLAAHVTVEQARANWSALLETRLAEQEQETARAKAEAEAAKRKSPGVEPLGHGASASTEEVTEGDPKEVFWAEVKRKQDAGLSRPAAIAAVIREKPDLYEEFLAANVVQDTRRRR